MVLAFFVFAEEEGFEPPVPRGTTVFKTAAFDHSATPLCNIGLHPNRMLRYQNSFSRPYSSRSCPRNWNAKIVYLMN